MRSRRHVVIVLIALAWLAAACKSSTTSPRRTYTDTAASFDEFARTLVDAVKSDRKADFEALAKTMVLPAPKAWFEATFGSETGARLLAEWERSPFKDVAQAWPDLRKMVAEQKRDAVTTSRHDSPDDENATGHQVNALRAMTKPVALYRLQLTTAEGERAFSIWSFALIDGQFRLVGKMKQVKPSDPNAKMAREVDMLGELPMNRARELLKEQREGATP